MMGAARQPPQNVFGPDDGKREGRERTVDGRHDHQAAGLQEGRAGGHECRRVEHVLDHLHVEDDVEPARLAGEVLGGGDTVVDRQSLGDGVLAGGADVTLGGIDARHLGPEPGHGLGEETAAAADIEEGQALIGAAVERIAAETGGQLLANIGEADRIELVKDGELAVRVPPLGGEG